MNLYFKFILATITLVLMTSSVSSAQTATLNGFVQNDSKEKLFGALLRWKDTNIGVYADEEGNFSIQQMDTTALLVVSYVGYLPVEITILPSENDITITLSGIVALSDVEIRAHVKDHFTSTLGIRAIEQISSGELRKAACCNLSESFETNGTVNIAYNDAVTGTKEIEMLGLRGLYTQLSIDNRPTLSGLVTPFALDYIPGTWLQSISVAKGTGSVLNGSNSISGQINLSIVKPNEDKPIFVNAYVSSMRRAELNVHLNKKFNDKISTGLLLHGNLLNKAQDTDDDTFMNIPLRKQLNGMYRLFYNNKKDIEGNFNIHALIDQLNGGQFIHNQDSPNDKLFTTDQLVKRIEFFGNTGYVGFDEPYKSIGSKYHVNMMSMRALLGQKEYTGEQKGASLDILHATAIRNPLHKLTFGVNGEYNLINEKLYDALHQYNYTNNWEEKIASGYAEYSLDNASPETHRGWGVIAGMRLDYHSKFGWIAVPRLNVKYNFSENLVIRFTAGRGYRTPRVLTDNFSSMVSNRIISIVESPKAEKAWNFGVNSGYNFTLAGREASMNIDIFHTTFQNQYVYDAEQSVEKIVFYNLNGKSYANNVLLMLTYSLTDNFDVKVAAKTNDTRITYSDGVLRSQPLLPKYRALLSLDFKSNNKQWQSNITFQGVGKQRLPNNDGVPAEYLTTHPSTAPAYLLVNAQVTYKALKNTEFYIGGENLTNYTQKQPIIAWQDTASPYFNAAQIYAPTMGARIYLGLRWWIDADEKH